jgi:N utilization substance protein A
VEALLPKSEQVYNERYDHGMRVKAVITDVSDAAKGPSIVVSRRNPDLIRKLFELEVPEIADKLVEIVGVAREPGYRSKIAVVSHTDGVDPVGACVGPRGSRVRMVVSELRGEKIDIIPYNEEPARFVAKALSPARVREVLVDDEEQQATVIVPDDQLSLAIGRDGQNARLAARLTGWRVDIKSETEFSREEDDIEYEGEEDFDGRCMAILSNGRRCPNAALSGSTYCGLPQHQALVRFDTNQVAVLSGLSDEDVALLANPDSDDGAVSGIVERASAALQEAEAEEVAEDEAALAAEEMAEEGVIEEATEAAATEEGVAEETTEEAAEEEIETEEEEAVDEELAEEEAEAEDVEEAEEVVAEEEAAEEEDAEAEAEEELEEAEEAEKEAEVVAEQTDKAPEPVEEPAE